MKQKLKETFSIEEVKDVKEESKMANMLFEQTKDERVNEELGENTNYFNVKEKYSKLDELLKELKKMDKSPINQGTVGYINDMYCTAENEMNDIIGVEEIIEGIDKEKVKEYEENHKGIKITNTIDELKIKAATSNKIIMECKRDIYEIYDAVYEENETYLKQGDTLKICELYQLLGVLEDEINTVSPKAKDIDFEELTAGNCSRHFVEEWQGDILYVTEKLKIYIMNIIGLHVSANFLESYNETLDITNFFIQTIIMDNDGSGRIERYIKEFDKEAYTEYLKEFPVDYLEYLKEFGSNKEYMNYKSKINHATFEEE